MFSPTDKEKTMKNIRIMLTCLFLLAWISGCSDREKGQIQGADAPVDARQDLGEHEAEQRQQADLLDQYFSTSEGDIPANGPPTLSKL